MYYAGKDGPGFPTTMSCFPNLISMLAMSLLCITHTPSSPLYNVVPPRFQHDLAYYKNDKGGMG